jgi:hypothetical protein
VLARQAVVLQVEVAAAEVVQVAVVVVADKKRVWLIK